MRNHPVSSIFRVAVAATVLLLPAGAVRSEVPGAKADLPAIVENVTVDIMNVEVVVSDSKGKRVTGLTKDDFELFQDGRPQAITNFFAVEKGALAPEVPAAPPVAGQPAPPPPAAAPAPRTWIVIYIDNQFLAPFNRNRAIKGVEDFLRKNLSSTAEAMVITADRDFKIRLRFTDRMGDLVEVLEKISEESSFGAGREQERNGIFQEIEDTNSIDRAEAIARNYARNVSNDLDFSLGALREALKTLSGLDGRKILLHVTDGMPASAGRELFEAISRKWQTAILPYPEFDRSMSYESIVNQANAVGVTMYTLDASGLSMGSAGSAEVGRPSSMTQVMTTTRWNSQDPLRQMADGTGGLAMLNRNDFGKTLGEVASDLGNYYSLGFPAPAAGTERTRRIEVKVKRPGLEVRTRRGYSEKSVVQRVNEQVVSSLFFPRNDNPLGVAVQKGKAKDAGRGAYHVPISVRIPIGRITLVPQGEFETGRVHIYFAVLDTEGKQSDVSTITEDITIPVADVAKARKREFIYDAKLLMLPGSQRLAVAVRDDISNQISFVTSDIFVSVFAGQEEKRQPPGPEITLPK